MYAIKKKEQLNKSVFAMEIEAPLVARAAKPGQFIILRVDSEGERIPLTVSATDKHLGTVRIVFAAVGASTLKLSRLNEGEAVKDFAGPLGMPTEIDGISKACVVGGGVGCAIALPVARALKEKGAVVDSVIGFRSSDLVILTDDFIGASDRVFLVTDDGSAGEAGRVTDPLERLLSGGEKYDMIYAIGPLVMMKFVTETAKKYDIPCTVSMNPVMIDGTGMCGGCRLTLNKGDKKVISFACVEGPDYNGYEVDFDEAISRSRQYGEFERHAYEKECNLFGGLGENG